MTDASGGNCLLVITFDYHQLVVIKGCFDNIEHSTLISLINSKIKDMRLIKLLWKFLKAGFMENWQYHSTHSGTPQGGIISSLLSNIYLHELDKFVIRLAEEFYRPQSKQLTSEAGNITMRLHRKKKKIGMTEDKETRKALLKEYRQIKAIQLKTPSKMQDDKKIKYVRYADDFIISVNGSKEDCIMIKQQLSVFIADVLKMELSEEKTLVTHSDNYARFLGYDVRVRRDSKIKPWNNTTKRTLNNTVELNIPLEDKIKTFLFAKGVIGQTRDGRIEPVKRTKLIRNTPLEVINIYDAELRGICNYYYMASNFNQLNYFSYLMEYSCLKTLAAKEKSKISKIVTKYKDGHGKWGIPYETKMGKKRYYLAKYHDCRKPYNPSDIISKVEIYHDMNVTTFESRLATKVCELCGTDDAKQYEIHHVNKVKNLKGKKDWERIMLAKRRKTLVVCKSCHDNIHYGNKAINRAL